MDGLDLVVFDVAGTTVRDDGGLVARCMAEAFAAAGLPTENEAIDRVMGLAKPTAIAQILEAHGRVARDADVARIHDDFVARMIATYRESSDVAEIPGARECFTQLREAGVHVALDTGFGRAIMDALLARLGWRVGETIDAVVTSDDVAHGRPHPDMILEAMRRTNVLRPSHVCKVGDTPADLLEGAAAGCALVVGVATGAHPLHSLRAFPHTHLVHDVSDVPALILHVDPEADLVPVHRSIF